MVIAFWQTMAIVNAIWAVHGTIDVGTFVQIGLVGLSLFQLIRLSRHERQAAMLRITVD